MSTREQAESVLFIHSTGTGPMLWSGVSNEAVGGREKIFAANLGYAPNPPIERGTVVTALDDANQVRRALPANGGKVHIVAHSYGAYVGLLLMNSIRDRLASLFFYEPVLFGALAAETAGDDDLDPEAIAQARSFSEASWFLQDNEKGGREEWQEFFIDYWNRPGSWKKMPEPLREHSLTVGWKMFQEVRACFFDQPSLDSWKIDVPTTIVRGERSPAASRAMAKALTRNRPNVALVDLPKVGHMAPLTHPAIVHEELARHMARVST